MSETISSGEGGTRESTIQERAVTQLQGLGLIRPGIAAMRAWCIALRNLNQQQLARGVRYAAEHYQDQGTIKPATFITWCKSNAELTYVEHGGLPLRDAEGNELWEFYRDKQGRDYAHHPAMKNSIPLPEDLRVEVQPLPFQRRYESIRRPFDALKADVGKFIERTQPPEAP